MYNYDRRLVATGAELPRKGVKYNGSFHGDDDGNWELGGYLRGGWDWDAAMSLARENEWRNLMVEGATEHHRGFRHALQEMVRTYPELADFVVKFDGPWIPVSRLVHVNTGPTVDLSNLLFYHGTNSTAAKSILREGLRPRSETNVQPAYGSSSSVGAGRSEAIYLTTQLQMARFAALDASKRGGYPVVLEVRGIDSSRCQADEDSGETDPVRSIERIGSIAYVGTIPPSKITLAYQIEEGSRDWTKVASGVTPGS
jgi:hypothetical protein